MKKVSAFVAVCLLCLLWVLTSHAAEKNFISAKQVSKYLKDMGIAGGNVEFIKTVGTSDPNWKVHIFTVKQDTITLPLVVYVNGKDMVVGILIRNGKLVVPDTSLEDMQPSVKLKTSGLTSENRLVYNSKGRKTIFLFSDPDCPYCKELESHLSTYKGEYRIVLKNFPIEDNHPGSTEKAVDRQCRAINPVCDSKTREKAMEIVKQDIEEGMNIGVFGTPFLVTQDGKVLQGVPDLKN